MMFNRVVLYILYIFYTALESMHFTNTGRVSSVPQLYIMFMLISATCTACITSLITSVKYAICRIVETLEMLGEAFDVNPGEDPVVSETDETVVQVEAPPDTAPMMGYQINPPGDTVVIVVAAGVLQTNDKVVTSIIKRNRIFPTKRVGGGRGSSIASIIVSMTIVGRTVSGLRQPVTLSVQASFVSFVHDLC